MTPANPTHLRESSSLLLRTYNQIMEVTDTHVVAGIVDGRLEVLVWNVAWCCRDHLNRIALWEIE